VNRQQLFEYFDSIISLASIKNIDDEATVVGKWSRVVVEEDGLIDLWICNPKNLTAGLGERKVTNMITSMKISNNSTLHRLDGEAWVKLSDKKVILTGLKLLGIRAKKKMTRKMLNSLKQQLLKIKSLKA
jgi:hypothetical protein